MGRPECHLRKVSVKFSRNRSSHCLPLILQISFKWRRAIKSIRFKKSNTFAEFVLAILTILSVLVVNFVRLVKWPMFVFKLQSSIFISVWFAFIYKVQCPVRLWLNDNFRLIDSSNDLIFVNFLSADHISTSILPFGSKVDRFD